MQILISILEVILVTVPALLVVAFTTVAERKTMASMQRRLGPNIVGFYGSLQAFADALKLLLKEYVAPTQSNKILFFIGPIITLIFSLLGYGVIPYGPGLVLGDMDLGILYSLAVSSLSTYGILLAGWSANSKYAFLGSLRSTAQLISYELILSSVILLVVLLTSSLNLTINVESQKTVYSIFPLLPLFIIFFIGAIAETNRAPFDLAEAESELVSGFMTEHSSVIFVFFFLAEYASIVLICIFTSILFLGGYLLGFFEYFDILLDLIHNYTLFDIIQGLIYSFTLGFKACFLVFSFIWIRASFPRARFDQLMSYCWTLSLPIIVAIIILMPCIMYYVSMLPCTIYCMDDNSTTGVDIATQASRTEIPPIETGVIVAIASCIFPDGETVSGIVTVTSTGDTIVDTTFSTTEPSSFSTQTQPIDNNNDSASENSQEFEYIGSDMLAGLTPVPGPSTEYHELVSTREYAERIGHSGDEIEAYIGVYGEGVQIPQSTGEWGYIGPSDPVSERPSEASSVAEPDVDSEENPSEVYSEEGASEVSENEFENEFEVESINSN